MMTWHQHNHNELIAKGKQSTLYLTRLWIMATESVRDINAWILYSCSNLQIKFTQNFLSEALSQYIKLQCRCRTVTYIYRINSFRYKASKIWKCLPPDIKKCLSLNVFKHGMTLCEGVWCVNKCMTNSKMKNIL